MTEKRPCVLTIAGSDPSGGAGFQADLRVFEALGVTGLSAITALTVQNSHGVRAVHPVPPRVLADQLRCLFEDFPVHAVKIGMLAGAEQVRALAAVLRDFRPPNIVLDPVLASTAGVPLLDDEGRQALLTELLSYCDLVTPNRHEIGLLGDLARDLTSVPAEDLVARQDVGEQGAQLNGERAASREVNAELMGAVGRRRDGPAYRLIGLGARAILVKGGHLPGAPVDLLLRGDPTSPGEAHEFGKVLGGRRVDTPHTHGTGCFLSSAIATYLAIGARLIEAIQCAKALLTLALTVPTAPGQGRGWPDVGAALRAINSPSPATSRHGDRLRVLASGLYVITDWRPRPGRSPDEFVEQAIAGGAATIQLRDKRLTAPELIDAARRLIGICRPRGALLIVNDRMDVALAAGADGVHLGPDDMAPAPARRILGQDRLIGVSTGTVEEARAAAPYASYLGVGAIFGSATKLDAGEAVGPGRITQIRAALGDACPPIVAIGGITARNIGEVARAGADTAAVVSAVADAEDVRAAVHRLNHDFLD